MRRPVRTAARSILSSGTGARPDGQTHDRRPFAHTDHLDTRGAVVRIGVEDAVQLFAVRVEDKQRTGVVSERTGGDETSLLVKAVEERAMRRTCREAFR